MFEKYNARARGFGRVFDGCKGNGCARLAPRTLCAAGALLVTPLTRVLVHSWADVTTTHAINSCIVKAAKLTEASRVYRGVAGGVLPDSFWEPNAQGVRSDRW